MEKRRYARALICLAAAALLTVSMTGLALAEGLLQDNPAGDTVGDTLDDLGESAGDAVETLVPGETLPDPTATGGSSEVTTQTSPDLGSILDPSNIPGLDSLPGADALTGLVSSLPVVDTATSLLNVSNTNGLGLLEATDNLVAILDTGSNLSSQSGGLSGLLDSSSIPGLDSLPGLDTLLVLLDPSNLPDIESLQDLLDPSSIPGLDSLPGLDTLLVLLDPSNLPGMDDMTQLPLQDIDPMQILRIVDDENQLSVIVTLDDLLNLKLGLGKNLQEAPLLEVIAILFDSLSADVSLGLKKVNDNALLLPLELYLKYMAGEEGWQEILNVLLPLELSFPGAGMIPDAVQAVIDALYEYLLKPILSLLPIYEEVVPETEPEEPVVEGVVEETPAASPGETTADEGGGGVFDHLPFTGANVVVFLVLILALAVGVFLLRRLELSLKKKSG